MSIPKTDKWIQVEWNNNGDRSVVNVRYLIKSLPVDEELRIGTVVTIGRKDDGTPLTATVVASARERHQLDQPAQEETGEQSTAGPSAQKEEPEDYSPSASDWEPSDDCSSEDSEEEDESKSVKLDRSKVRQYPNKTTRKVLTPTHRPAAVIPNGMQQLALRNLMNRKRKHDITNNGAKTQPDSTRKNQNKFGVYEEVINKMKAMFQELFRIMGEVKPSVSVGRPSVNDTALIDQDVTQKTVETTDQSINDAGRILVIEGTSDSDCSDSSDENVLITNKYDRVKSKNDKADKGEWIPIGSGTTLIHKDKYRKVNWKSYTIATRTLLLAAFSRRTLATHSLTGKKSPAFTNKPAKTCLDPKIVSDIVIEITDRFKVKDNLVRGIITTKCADECKMQKMKMTKKKTKNQENVPPSDNKTTK